MYRVQVVFHEWAEIESETQPTSEEWDKVVVKILEQDRKPTYVYSLLLDDQENEVDEK